MFLSAVLYLSSQSIQPLKTVDQLKAQLHASGYHFSLVIVLSKKHNLTKELQLGQFGIIYTVEDTLSISEGLNEGLKFVNQSKIHSDYVCLFYDDFKLSEGYFNALLEGINGDIDNVLIVPNYLKRNIDLPDFSLNGVVLRYPFFQLMLGRLCEEYISWEDYPYYYALARRYKVIKSEASFTRLDTRFDLKNQLIKIGQGYKEKKYSYILVFKTLLKSLSRFDFYSLIFIFLGYLKGAKYKYPSKILRKTTPSKLRELSHLLSSR
jgi:hypothetical protein